MKRLKDGTIEWEPDEETQIEMATEARVRAHNRLSAAKVKQDQDAACKKGSHGVIKTDGACENCGEKPQPAPGPAKRRQHLSM